MWHIYILHCNDNTFYTGITTDLERRLKEHNFSSKGAKYSSIRRPVTLQYHECAINRSEASKREHQIKKLSHHQKAKIISQSIKHSKTAKSLHFSNV